MKKNIACVVYIICLLLGALFSYIVIKGAVLLGWEIILPYPDFLDRRGESFFATLFLFPIIIIVLYKMNRCRFDRIIALVFLCLWLVYIGLIRYAFT